MDSQKKIRLFKRRVQGYCRKRELGVHPDTVSDDSAKPAVHPGTTFVVTGGKEAGEEVEFGELNGGETTLEYKSDSEAAIIPAKTRRLRFIPLHTRRITIAHINVVNVLAEDNRKPTRRDWLK
jgi:hypothetical protein